MAIAEEVASVLRHELRNKFASVLNAASYIERSLRKLELLERDPRILRFLKLIGEQLSAADGLLDQRARHADRFSPCVEVLRLDECVREAVVRTAHPAEVSLEFVVEAQPLVRGDFEEIVLVVQCLLDNAVEAVSPCGRIDVSIHQHEIEALVQIADSGPGIAEGERSHVLEPFVSTKLGHSGLGLSIASRLARLHGGRLEIGESHDLAGAQIRLAFTRHQ